MSRSKQSAPTSSSGRPVVIPAGSVVPLGEAAGAIGVGEEYVIAEAQRLGVPLVEDWQERICLPVETAAHIVRSFRQLRDEHSERESLYAKYLRLHEQGEWAARQAAGEALAKLSPGERALHRSDTPNVPDITHDRSAGAAVAAGKRTEWYSTPPVSFDTFVKDPAKYLNDAAPAPASTDAEAPRRPFRR